MEDTEVGAEAMAEVDVSGMDFARLSASEQVGARGARNARTEGPALRERVIEEAAAMVDDDRGAGAAGRQAPLPPAERSRGS